MQNLKTITRSSETATIRHPFTIHIMLHRPPASISKIKKHIEHLKELVKICYELARICKATTSSAPPPLTSKKTLTVALTGDS